MRATHIAILVGVLAAVLAATGALYVLILRDAATHQSGMAKPTRSEVATPLDRTASPQQGTAIQVRTRAAELPLPDGDDDGAASLPTREYRTFDPPPPDPNATLRRPFSTKRIEAKVVAKMAQELRREAIACKAKHGEEIGEDAQAQPRATFNIKEGRLTVTGVELSLTGIEENGMFRSCLESAAKGLVVDATDHRDVEVDVMNVPIRL